MPADALKPQVTSTEQNRTLFLVYSTYRLAIASILLLLFFAGSGLGSEGSTLFLFSTVIYLGCNLILVGLFLRHWQPSLSALLLVLASDIVLLQLVAQASGIVQSGLGVLLVVSVAAGSIFLQRRQVLLVPSFATITLLLNVSLDIANGNSAQSDLVASGWLGITFFVTSITVQYLTGQLRASELVAQRESAIAQKLGQLNSLVIERMQTGIAIINDDNNIVLFNRSAQKLLGSTEQLLDKSLQSINEPTFIQLKLWKSNKSNHKHNSPLIQSFTGGPTIKLSFIQLSEDGSGESLMFIEDISKITQHAQQLKLASLGKLTASIAHEIRNPLGAASHAAQLLEESDISTEDKKLTHIISQQTKRCSNIIESVISVSRGEASNIKPFDLVHWLPGFLESYNVGKQYSVELHSPDSLFINFDSEQLAQILTNLIDNGIRHSISNNGEEQVYLHVGLDHDKLPYLDVIDQGTGVAEKNIQRLFEPFFTTEQAGSGLGLYMCRELCEANQARITYIPHYDGTARQASSNSPHCFRINFAHPDKKALELSPPTEKTAD